MGVRGTSGRLASLTGLRGSQPQRTAWAIARCNTTWVHRTLEGPRPSAFSAVYNASQSRAVSLHSGMSPSAGTSWLATTLSQSARVVGAREAVAMNWSSSSATVAVDPPCRSQPASTTSRCRAARASGLVPRNVRDRRGFAPGSAPGRGSGFEVT